MRWNWQQADWPEFSYDKAVLEPLERQFLLRAGELLGVLRYIGPEERDDFRIELIGDEALGTSAIEGEVLNRDSVQSSLRQQFGLSVEARRIPPAERGIAELMVDVYQRFAEPLSHSTLFSWHEKVMSTRGDVGLIGGYRQHTESMQIVSGSFDRPRVHFEAPPSAQVRREMDKFVAWFNNTAPGSKAPLPVLTRAGISHLYFESIHPFEDGNGRLGRALSEKVLAQHLGQPSLIALSYTIERNRKRYYDLLEASNKYNLVTRWLSYFAETVIDAQCVTLLRLEFYVAKARFHERFRGMLNERQAKAVDRMFRAGIDGFKGGLSAENYISITGASRATSTRDLQDLVKKGALIRRGERRHTRYDLNLGHENP